MPVRNVCWVLSFHKVLITKVSREGSMSVTSFAVGAVDDGDILFSGYGDDVVAGDGVTARGDDKFFVHRFFGRSEMLYPLDSDFL